MDLSNRLFNRPIDINIIDQQGSDFVSELKFDVIRIDCAGYDFEEHYNIIKNSAKMLNDNGIIVVDDITPMHFAKLHSFLEALYDNKIFPVVYGTDSIVCAATSASQEILFKKISPLVDLLELKQSRIRKKDIWFVGPIVSINEAVTDYNNQ